MRHRKTCHIRKRLITSNLLCFLAHGHDVLPFGLGDSGAAGFFGLGVLQCQRLCQGLDGIGEAEALRSMMS